MLFFNDIRRNAMKKSMTGLLAAAITAGIFGMNPAAAYEAGDFIARAGAAGVYPTGKSDGIGGLGKVEADSAWSLGLSFTYLATDNIGVSLLGAWPFEHDINGESGALDKLDDPLAETKHLPPTLTLQYHFDLANKKVHPFIGAGVNYTYFFDEEAKGDLDNLGVDVDIDNSWGWALEAGLDYELDNNWLVGAQIFYISIEPEADFKGTPVGNVNNVDVEIDPWVFMVSVGRKF
jgi:outer membrane protein